MTEPTPVRTAAELRAWIAAAAPGDVACYHTGCLAVARGPEAPARTGRLLGALADAVMAAHDAGLVAPCHRRLGPARWAYLAQRTRRPASKGVVPARQSTASGFPRRVREAAL